MDSSPPGSSVHGIFQARILEWVAISSTWDLPNPWIKPVSCHLLHCQADSLLLHRLGSPVTSYSYLINHSIPNINGTKVLGCDNFRKKIQFIVFYGIPILISEVLRLLKNHYIHKKIAQLLVLKIKTYNLMAGLLWWLRW